MALAIPRLTLTRTGGHVTMRPVASLSDLPTGGTEGQVLAIGEDGLEWVDPPEGGGEGGSTDLSVTRSASTVTIASSTGADAVVPVVDANAGLMSPAMKTKLDGIATAATENSSDATLLARGSHTGTQPSSTISDFTEAVQDAVAALLAQGTNVTLTYNDASNSLTVAATGGGGGLDAEAVRDAMGVAMIGTGAVSVTVNDAADTITISTTATANDTDANLRARSSHTGTQSADTVVDGTTNKAYTAAEKTKLAAVASGATANSADATLLARANHTGTQSADTVVDGATNKVYTATEKTKLAAIAAAATANAADAYLLARVNHTGQQPPNQDNTLVTPATEYFARMYLDENAGSFASAPNRFQFYVKRSGASTYSETGGFNEYGEGRFIPAKNNTVALRVFQRQLPTDPARNMAINLFEVMDNRNDRNILMGIAPDGTIATVADVSVGDDLTVGDDVTVGGDITATGTVAAANVLNKVVCVPTGTSGFASQPDGTLWVEYTP